MKALVFALTLVAAQVIAAETNTFPRAARSVHLRYPAPEGDLFYNEMVVTESVNGSYFMACGWNTGYFGIQQLGSSTNKVAIFSVWDPTKGDDQKAVKLEDRVELLYEGAGVRIKRFGGEGTGGQCMTPFAWKIGETNRCKVKSRARRPLIPRGSLTTRRTIGASLRRSARAPAASGSAAITRLWKIFVVTPRAFAMCAARITEMDGCTRAMANGNP